MGYGRKASGGGSSNVLCTATAANVLEGVTAITSDDPLPVAGTMENVAAIDEMKSVVLSSSQLYVRMTNGAHVTNASSGYPEVSGAASSFISALGIASITNFKIAQYASKRLQLTWVIPSKGLWSGVRIVGKLNSQPSSPTDGTVTIDSGSSSTVTSAISAGTWYFRAYNYITWTGGRTYGSYSSAAFTNRDLSGSKNFTSGGTWTAPGNVTVQYFLVGGGGGSRSGNEGSGTANIIKCGSGGGGGGYTKSGSFTAKSGATYTIVVGSGGTGRSAGGSSSISGSGVSVSASGGGYGGSYATLGYWCAGSGGSGGGASATKSGATGGTGGSNGGSGGSTASASGGSGQGSSTKCPWDSVLYSGGGGGTGIGSGGKGSAGSGGGGTGGIYAMTDSGAAYGTNGTTNTGGGGGGGGKGIQSTSGGSGIVRLKWS